MLNIFSLQWSLLFTRPSENPHSI